MPHSSASQVTHAYQFENPYVLARKLTERVPYFPERM